MSHKRKYVILLFIICLSFGIYANTLSHNFVWDDSYEIFENAWIKDLKFIPNIFFSHSLGWTITTKPISKQYYPLKLVVRALQYRLFETDPWGYHLTNVIVHVLSTVMVFLIGTSLFNKFYHENSMTFPAIASLLFAIHPIHTEAVNWVSSLAELSMSFFCLLSFYIYIKTDERSLKKFIISAIFFFAAMLFKITAIFFLLVFFSYDYSIKKGLFADNLMNKDSRKAILKRYIPFIIATAAYLILRNYALSGIILTERTIAVVIDTLTLLLNIPFLFSKYLELLVYPVNLKALYVFHPVSSLTDSKFLVALFITTIFIPFILISRVKNIGLFFSSLWIVILLLPCLYLPASGFSFYVFAERYLYLPSVGFVAAIAIISRSIYRRRFLKGLTVPLLLLTLIISTVLSTLTTFNRNYIWRDNYNLWMDTVQKSPDSPIAHNNLGCEYEKKGWVDDALREYETAITLDPSYSDPYYNRYRLLKTKY